MHVLRSSACGGWPVLPSGPYYSAFPYFLNMMSSALIDTSSRHNYVIKVYEGRVSLQACWWLTSLMPMQETNPTAGP